MMPTRRIEIPVTVTRWDQAEIYLNQINPEWKTPSVIGGGIVMLLTFLRLLPKKKDNDSAPAHCLA
jgi:GTPase